MTRKTRRPTARCPYCGKRRALTDEGKIWAHRQSGTGPPGTRPMCGGSGHYPVAGS